MGKQELVTQSYLYDHLTLDKKGMADKVIIWRAIVTKMSPRLKAYLFPKPYA